MHAHAIATAAMPTLIVQQHVQQEFHLLMKQQDVNNTCRSYKGSCNSSSSTGNYYNTRCAIATTVTLAELARLQQHVISSSCTTTGKTTAQAMASGQALLLLVTSAHEAAMQQKHATSSSCIAYAQAIQTLMQRDQSEHMQHQNTQLQ